MLNLRPTTLCAALVMSLLALSLGACQPAANTAAPTALTEAEQAANELAQDVGLLGVINRLDLQPAQLQPLQAVVAQAADAQAKAEPARQAALAALVPLLREKRSLLLKDQDVPEELEQQLGAAQNKVNDAEEGAARAPLSVIGSLRKVLTEDQVAIITGADEALSQAVDLLDWVRDLNAGTYAEEGQSNADQLADPDVKLSSADIMKVFDEIRKLSDADYTAKKGQYAAKLAPLYSPTTDAANQALAEFISAPRLEVLLKERLAL